MGVAIDDLPVSAAGACLALRDGLADLLGQDLAAMWLYGGTTFPDRPEVPGDLDICAVVSQTSAQERDPKLWGADPDSRPFRIVSLVEEVAVAWRVSFDTVFLLSGDMGRAEPPDHAYVAGRSHTGWSIERAHWLAGQYVHLRGPRPEDLVLAPSREEVMAALDRELEHLERHVFEGDAADPYEATYAIWNGCRILYTLETGSPVISKRSAGAWGREHLPKLWREAVGAAGRSYDGRASDHDRQLLRDSMGPFVAMVRERLPVTGPRPAGPPRWS